MNIDWLGTGSKPKKVKIVDTKTVISKTKRKKKPVSLF